MFSTITSCRRIPADGIPIPWDIERIGPTLYIAYLQKGETVIEEFEVREALKENCYFLGIFPR